MCISESTMKACRLKVDLLPGEEVAAVEFIKPPGMENVIIEKGHKLQQYVGKNSVSNVRVHIQKPDGKTRIVKLSQ